MRRRLRRLSAPVPRTSAIPADDARASLLVVDSFRAYLQEQGNDDRNRGRLPMQAAIRSGYDAARRSA
jgi:hypothetical protein